MYKVAYFCSFKSYHLPGLIEFPFVPSFFTVIKFGIGREYSAELEDEGEGREWLQLCTPAHDRQ